MNLRIVTSTLCVYVFLFSLDAFATTTSPLSLQEFKDLYHELSGPGGQYSSDNFISNEIEYLYVVPGLKKRRVKGGAYIGVGSEQNFSYLATIRPEIAFILDIRRDNVTHILFYKALFETSPTPQAFLANLLGRDLGASGNKGDSLNSWVKHLKAAKTDRKTHDQKSRELWEKMITYGITLHDADRKFFNKLREAFFRDQFALRWVFTGRMKRIGVDSPNLEELLMASDPKGHERCFLANAKSYEHVRSMFIENRIIPVLGDFAGNKALRAIGTYLKGRKITLSAFYVSNVEFFLYKYHSMRRFVENVKRLPVGKNSLFIRSFYNNEKWKHKLIDPNHRFTSTLQSFSSFQKVMSGSLRPRYRDLVTYEAFR